MMRRLAALGVGLSAVAAAACGPPPLECTHATPEALGRAVLAAVAQNDIHALRALAVSEQEFRAHVWPELPAARPERNLPCSYVWGDLRQKSEQHLARTLATHGGRRYHLVRVEYGGGTQRYGDYAVHGGATFVVRDDSGGEAALRLFGSVLEKDGRFKVFSFVAAD